jgi:predicted nucleotidyltransferase
METMFSSALVRQMLTAFAHVLQQLDIDFFLVGAAARDIRLSADPGYTPKRATKDVDIAIMLASEKQFYQVKEALLATGDFTAHDELAIKLYYKQGVEIDLLPF